MSDTTLRSGHELPESSLPEHAHDEHHRELRHHFDDMAQQFEASHLGMWIFLITEVMFFGGMFAGYSVYRMLYSQAWADTSQHMDVILGGLNTAVLIGSSLTMVLAVRAAQLGSNRSTAWFLLGTIGLGSVFLIVKVFEYGHKWEERLVPGPYFRYAEPYSDQAQLFFSFYFAMTGMHALHMIVGIAMLLVLVYMARKKRFSSEWYTPVEMIGLYWHFVDIVWIFLFPLLYLIGQHSLGGGH